MTSEFYKDLSTKWADIPLMSGVPTLSKAFYRVKDGVCYVDVVNVGSWSYPKGSWQTFAILPEDARPTREIGGSFSSRAGTIGEWYIHESGYIGVRAYGSGNASEFAQGGSECFFEKGNSPQRPSGLFYWKEKT